jgi:hypothetical protein
MTDRFPAGFYKSPMHHFLDEADSSEVPDIVAVRSMLYHHIRAQIAFETQSSGLSTHDSGCLRTARVVAADAGDIPFSNNSLVIASISSRTIVGFWFFPPDRVDHLRRARRGDRVRVPLSFCRTTCRTAPPSVPGEEAAASCVGAVVLSLCAGGTLRRVGAQGRTSTSPTVLIACSYAPIISF